MISGQQYISKDWEEVKQTFIRGSHKVASQMLESLFVWMPGSERVTGTLMISKCIFCSTVPFQVNTPSNYVSIILEPLSGGPSTSNKSGRNSAGFAAIFESEGERLQASMMNLVRHFWVRKNWYWPEGSGFGCNWISMPRKPYTVPFKWSLMYSSCIALTKSLM